MVYPYKFSTISRPREADCKHFLPTQLSYLKALLFALHMVRNSPCEFERRDHPSAGPAIKALWHNTQRLDALCQMVKWRLDRGLQLLLQPLYDTRSHRTATSPGSRSSEFCLMSTPPGLRSVRTHGWLSISTSFVSIFSVGTIIAIISANTPAMFI